MKLLAKALGVLPTGTLLVGAGLVVLGAGSYAHLAIAGHSLSTSGMATVAVLWSIVFFLGLGLFFPVEQEIIRHVAARAATGAGITPVVRRGTLLAGGILAVTLVPLAAAARPLAGWLFDGNIGMVGALATAFAALAVVSVSRGVLAGMGRFKAYGTQLGLDGALRIFFAVALAAAGSHSPLLFGLILTAAPLVSAVLTVAPAAADLRPGPPIRWRQLCRGLGLLITSTLLAQLVVNIAVINVKLLSPGDPAVVGALLAAMVLARVPLFVFASLQASLLPGLAGAIAAGDQARYRQLVIRGNAIVIALGLACGLPVVIFGPRLVPLLFGVHPVLGSGDFALLACGTLLYMIAMVLGQSSMALSRHRDQLLAWIAGTLVLAAITMAPGTVKLRVEAAYALSSLTVAVGLAVALRFRLVRLRQPPPPADGRVTAALSSGGSE